MGAILHFFHAYRVFRSKGLARWPCVLMAWASVSPFYGSEGRC
jgi:hypothetical protein